ncbi:OadG family protein [Desulfovermiculus halophilus]|uniref:OadG family protein n=1 Tax=Desulfovermiculus halophilus TaxID=339722 RepID=UPI0004898435|nr:OadG family protein [Desulfovermiculus halophilus]
MERFLVGTQVTLLGMVTVIGILLLLYLAMVILRHLAGPKKEEASGEPEPDTGETSPEEVPAQGSGKQHDPKVIAAITAAVLATCDADARRPRAFQLSRPARQWKTLGRAKAVAGMNR